MFNAIEGSNLSSLYKEFFKGLLSNQFQDNNPENGSQQLQTGLTQQNTTDLSQTQQTTYQQGFSNHHSGGF